MGTTIALLILGVAIPAVALFYSYPSVARAAIARQWDLFFGPPQATLMGAKPERKRVKGIEKLYVMQVDFPVNAATREALDAALAPLREKYGIDFLLLEPGIRLSKFDDI